MTYPSIETHPRPRICNQPNSLLLFFDLCSLIQLRRCQLEMFALINEYCIFAGWAPSWYLGPSGPSSAFDCPSCCGLSKFSSITVYMRDVLHWLPIFQRIQYSITAMVSRRVLRCAPPLTCTFATSAGQCRVLHSATRG